VDRLEHRHLVAEIGRRRDTEAPDQAGREIGQDVAVHVGHDRDVELLRPDDHLMGAVVDDHVLMRQRRVVLQHLLADALQHALGELHDVGLGGDGDLLPPLGLRHRRREAEDALAAHLGDDLQALRDARRLHVLDAGIDVLDILADHDEVDPPAGEGRPDAGQFPHRADIAVHLEGLAKRDIGRLLAIADRRLQRPLQRHAVAGDGIQRLLRRAGGDAAAEGLGAGQRLLPLHLGAGRRQHRLGGLHHLRPDAVAGNGGDLHLGPHGRLHRDRVHGCAVLQGRMLHCGI
jgi:hypothetical protein